MGILEIVLLSAGAIIFIGSFLAPVKKEKLHEETKRLAENEVKTMVSEEMAEARRKLGELSEEALQEQMDQAKRSMERISNEKIMAVNEYSDTVLEEIHKNHEEVVFMYDMLTDKQDTLKTTVATADKDIKELLQQVKDSELTLREEMSKKEMQESAQVPEETAASEEVAVGVESMPTGEAPKDLDEVRSKFTAVKAEIDAIRAKNDLPEPVMTEVEEGPSFIPFKPEKVNAVPKKQKKTPAKRKTAAGKKKEEAPAREVGMELEFSGPNKKDNGKNSNERILELHRAGKSNMAIAKELGLGIGEVKLVIDLYKG